MERCDNIPLKKTEDNKRVRSSTMMPTIEPSTNDIYIITTPGDRLDLLSFRYYGTVSYWWIIAQANTNSNVGKGTMVIPAGLQLRIPTNPMSILMEYDKINR